MKETREGNVGRKGGGRGAGKQAVKETREGKVERECGKKGGKRSRKGSWEDKM